MKTLTAPNPESCNIYRDHLTASEVKLLIEVVKNKLSKVLPQAWIAG